MKISLGAMCNQKPDDKEVQLPLQHKHTISMSETTTANNYLHILTKTRNKNYDTSN